MNTNKPARTMSAKYARTRRNWGFSLASIFFLVWLLATFAAANEMLSIVRESTDTGSVAVMATATIFLLLLLVLAWVFYQDAQKMRAYIDKLPNNP